MRPDQIRLPELDGLRGLLALWVVLGHWSATIAPPGLPVDPRLHNGAAVGLFMLLSGFVIAARIDQRPEPWPHYIARRALRLFPAYLPVLLIAIALTGMAPDIWAASPDTSIRTARLSIARDTLAAPAPHIWAHLGLLQGLVPPEILPATDFAFVGQAWSLSLEWQFYLVAPFLVALFANQQRLSNLLPGLLILLGLATIALYLDMPAGFLGRHLPEFLGGIASWFLHSRLRPLRLAPAGIALAAAVLLAGHASALAPALWIATLAALLDPRTAAVGRFLRHPLLLWLGARSYPVYLTHMLALMAALVLTKAPVPMLVFTLGITFALSAALHRFVEAPAMAYARRLFRVPLEPIGDEGGCIPPPLEAQQCQQAAQADPELGQPIARRRVARPAIAAPQQPDLAPTAMACQSTRKAQPVEREQRVEMPMRLARNAAIERPRS